MVATLAQINKKIELLSAQAEKVRLSEVRGVVTRINEAIAFYGIKPSDLTFPASVGPAFGAKQDKSRNTTSKKILGSKRVMTASIPKTSNASAKRYADGAGNNWGGMGPRPAWLRTAIASGKELASFLVGAPLMPKKASAKTSSMPVSFPSKVAAKYRNAETGDTWSGRGLQPKWLKVALGSGKKLADFELKPKAAKTLAKTPVKKSLPMKLASPSAPKVTAKKSVAPNSKTPKAKSTVGSKAPAAKTLPMPAAPLLESNQAVVAA